MKEFEAPRAEIFGLASDEIMDNTSTGFVEYPEIPEEEVTSVEDKKV